MAKHFDVHLLAEPPVPQDGDPYDITQGGIVFRGLPFVAWPTGDPPGARFEVLRSWPRYPRARLKILHALDAAKANNAHVYRLSLAVTRSRDPEADALAYATRFLRDKNRIVVAAAGNWGPGPGTLSDLACARSVISVAACGSNGLPLDCSGRGTVDGPKPTLAADGTDPAGQSTPGTSLAAARVAVLCVWIRSLLQSLTSEASAAYAGESLVEMPRPSRLAHVDSDFTQSQVDSLVSMRVGRAVFPSGSIRYSGATVRRIKWLTRVIDYAGEHQVYVAFDYGPDWVLRVLLAAADTGPWIDPIACGAGVVSRDSVRDLLTGMTPSRFLRFFVNDGYWDERRAAVGAALDEDLEELWSVTDLELFEQLYAAEYEDLFIEIGVPGEAGHGNTMLRVSGTPTTFTNQPVYAHIDVHGNLTIDDPEAPTNTSCNEQ
ncbi:S8 family serine peptidase [Ornithinimicrobium flavum]|uniref:S8 family serine peptidase n=1 Tax=Ornithinimicrobium flavum TaxID=1288636 RepID=UPI00130510C4|nr:S8 family serine peptidase [Ornithinimicrobium flavum]